MSTVNNLSSSAHASAASTAPVGDASPREVHRWLQSGEAVLVDVREPDEHARERIAGARLLPLSRFDPQQALAQAKPGQRLVVHCRSGRRSADAVRMARSLSDARVAIVNMTGGIEAWKKDNLPVQVNTKFSGMSVMRQVQLVIGVCVLAGAALAWFAHPGFIAIPAFFGAGLTFAGATGTCAMAAVIGRMPWNRAGTAGRSCAAGTCG